MSDAAETMPLRVMIAGGGTGGHVIPALALGRALREGHAAEVLYIGTARGLETRLVPEAGFPLELVRSGQWKNVSVATRLRTLLDVPLGVAHCMKLMRTWRPQVVVGVGGYASGPAMLAALLRRTPAMVYEPNAAPGLTNRLVGKRVDAAAVAYPSTTKFFRNAVVTGVPVREAIFAVHPKREGAPRLLVTAGSQGARVFNEVLPAIAGRLLELVAGLTIVHQAGPKNLESTRAAYAAAGIDSARVRIEAFLADMPGEYAAADLVLARSGSTVAELAAAGKPSLLVPLPTAADDHQRRNAEMLEEVGGARMLLQSEASAERLSSDLMTMLSDRDALLAMGERARTLARPRALEAMCAMVVRLAAR